MTKDQKRASLANKLAGLEVELATAESLYANEKPKQTLETLARVMQLRSEVGSYRALLARAESDLTAPDENLD